MLRLERFPSSEGVKPRLPLGIQPRLSKVVELTFTCCLITAIAGVSV